MQEQGEACWPHACLDGAPDALSSLIPTPDESSSRDNATDASNGSRYGMTSRPSTDVPGAAQLTLFPEASPVKTSPQRVRVEDCPEIVRVLFSRCCELLRRRNLALSSRKTVRSFVPVDLAPSSNDLTAWGISHDGVCWELGTSARLIEEIECGSLLPTPTARRGSWPTPQARDWKDTTPAHGNRKSPGLGVMVHLWPTPTAGDAKGSGRRCANPNSKANAGTSLTDAVNGGPTIPRTGKLNPSWVESYLMGWPLGWTDLKPLEMDRFREWLRSHGTF